MWKDVAHALQGQGRLARYMKAGDECLKEFYRPMRSQGVARERIYPLCQPDEPAALDVFRCQLR